MEILKKESAREEKKKKNRNRNENAFHGLISRLGVTEGKNL